MKKFDLHIHTTESDGKKSPKEVVDIIKEMNKIYSITDHDDIGGYKYVNPAITGAEIAVCHNGRLLDVLIYGIDINLCKWITFLTKERKIERQNLILDELIDTFIHAGFTLKEKPIVTNECFAHNALYFEIVKHRENETLIRENGWNSSRKFYLDMINPDFAYYPESYGSTLPTIQDLNKIVSALGGKMIVAHPFKYFNHIEDYSIRNTKVTQLLDSTLGFIDGVEVLHPSAEESDSILLSEYCLSHNLIGSGGSDWHQKDSYKGTPNFHLTEVDNFKQLYHWIYTSQEMEFHEVVQ